MISISLIPGWKEVLVKAWSVRWIIAAAILSGAEVALPVITAALEGEQVVPRGSLALLAALTSGGALVARVLAQGSKAGDTK